MDNPPPKIVQGYKFNIFYPDLIDKNTTPEYIVVSCNSPHDTGHSVSWPFPEAVVFYAATPLQGTVSWLSVLPILSTIGLYRIIHE
jgi:hypothetical protein